MRQVTKELLTVSEVQLSYNPEIKPSQRLKIEGSKTSYEVFKAGWDMQTMELREDFKVMLLNKGNKVLGIYNASSGGIDGTIADLRLIFATALKSCATAIVVAHNHPSGNLKPSSADIALTKKLVKAGELLNIIVMDSLIITEEGYYSLMEEGLM